MQKLNALVVDDERPAQDELAFLLNEHDRIAEVRCAASGLEVLRMMEVHHIDALFLDIAMPEFTGIELARVLGRFENPPAIIFVTAHDEYAVEAFEINVVDYLLKPVTAQRVDVSVRRLLDLSSPALQSQTLAVERAGVTRFIRREDVIWVEAHGDYVRLHLRHDHHLLRTSLSTLAERWSPVGFVRIHRSYLVDVKRIEELRTEGNRATVVVDGTELEVSRRHLHDLRARLFGQHTALS